MMEEIEELFRKSTVELMIPQAGKDCDFAHINTAPIRNAVYFDESLLFYCKINLPPKEFQSAQEKKIVDNERLSDYISNHLRFSTIGTFGEEERSEFAGMKYSFQPIIAPTTPK
jgi:hypothetical protein